MPKSIYLDNNFLNAALRGIPFTPPPAIYVALYTVAPGVGDAGTEVSAGDYFRQLVQFTVPVDGKVVSVDDVLFPVAQTFWGSIAAFTFMDASAGGHILYIGNLSAPRTVDAQDQVRMPAGQLICIEA